MTNQQLLNANLYPSYGDTVRRKQFPYFDDVAMVAGVTDYQFFVLPPAPFLRNKQLPVKGDEIFFITGISALPVLNHITTAQIDALNELLQQSYLEIIINNRLAMKIPGLDFINYQYSDAWSDQVVVTANKTHIGGHLNSNGFLGRLIDLCPLIMNSNSAFTFRLVTPGNAAYDGIHFKLVLHGLQMDKLAVGSWDDIENNLFQQIPWTMWQTTVIPNGNLTIFQLFNNPALAPNLFSNAFPLSDIVTFSCQNIEVFVNQPDAPIAPATIWNSRIDNRLYVQVDDVIYYDGNLQNMLSLLAGFGQTLTTTPNLDIVNVFEKRQSLTFKVPLNFPANSNVVINLTQPAASLGITGEFTVAMRGLINRRVA